MAKLTPPNPTMFDPDALEQLFAKGVTARDNTAGLSASWLLMQNADRMKDQDRYMGALGRVNQMDAALAAQEQQAKLREQGMKSATELIKEGFLPSTTNAGTDIFNNTAEGDNYAKMLQMLTQSKINKNNQPAGGGSKDSTTVQMAAPGYENADGTPARGPVVITGKSSNPATAQANAEAAFRQWGAVAKNPNASPAQKAEAIRQMNQMTSRPGIQQE